MKDWFWKTRIGRWYNRNAFAIHLIMGNIWYTKIVYPFRALQEKIGKSWCKFAHNRIVIMHVNMRLKENKCDCGRHWMETYKT